ncbi:MAG TPA: hypothetical protein VFT01_10570 [Homoserinimonas sp.]|nr:hypothetical protein [Homoserinimonas sp.]
MNSGTRCAGAERGNRRLCFTVALVDRRRFDKLNERGRGLLERGGSLLRERGGVFGERRIDRLSERGGGLLRDWGWRFNQLSDRSLDGDRLVAFRCGGREGRGDGESDDYSQRCGQRDCAATDKLREHGGGSFG